MASPSRLHRTDRGWPRRDGLRRAAAARPEKQRHRGRPARRRGGARATPRSPEGPRRPPGPDPALPDARSSGGAAPCAGRAPGADGHVPIRRTWVLVERLCRHAARHDPSARLRVGRVHPDASGPLGTSARRVRRRAGGALGPAGRRGAGGRSDARTGTRPGRTPAVPRRGTAVPDGPSAQHGRCVDAHRRPVGPGHAHPPRYDGLARLSRERPGRGGARDGHTSLRTGDGTYEDRRWKGTWCQYEHRDGLCVPTAGEVAWMQSAEEVAYWRGRIHAIDYQFADRTTLDARRPSDSP